MNQKYYLPQPFNIGEGSRALWAIRSCGEAFVFIHGFHGHALKTWDYFPRFFQNEDKYCKFDLLFLGYDSNQPTEDSASILAELLDKLFSDPSSLINNSLNQSSVRSQEFQYKRIYLVAHSMGAVLCRRALLDAHNNKKEWVRNVSMILFAPAHTGTKIPRLISEVFFGGLILSSAVDLAKKYWAPSLFDIEDGSETLRILEERTFLATQNDDANYLIAKKVIFGRKDRTVEWRQFGKDPLPKGIPGKGHCDVCKPFLYLYEDPFSEVMDSV